MRALEKNTTLKTLATGTCRLQAANFAVLARVLQKNSTLQSLHWSENDSNSAVSADLEQTIYPLLKRNQLVFPFVPLFS